MATKLLNDFLLFSQMQFDTLDFDTYLATHYELQRGLTREEGLQLSLLFMARYNVGSGWLAFTRAVPSGVRLPVSGQRRNFYPGGMVNKHLASVGQLRAAYGGTLWGWLTHDMQLRRPSTAAQLDNWHILQRNLGQAWGNGRWACYTSGDLLTKINGVPAIPADLGNKGSSGALAGLRRVVGVAAVEADADKAGAWLMQHSAANLRPRVPYLPAGQYDYAMLESNLCNFNNLCKGRYYCGRDVDRDQARALRAAAACSMPDDHPALRAIWTARAKWFDPLLLGEVQGWRGIDKQRLKIYATTGRLVDRRVPLQ